MTVYTFLLYTSIFVFNCSSCTSDSNQKTTSLQFDLEFAKDSTPGISPPGDVFSVSLPGVVGSGDPKIGEWTRTAAPDESIVLTGYKLSSFSGIDEGKDTRFMVYGSRGVKKEARIQRLDGDKAIITLDKDLPSWSMYLLQPGNDAGWGKAVAINKTDAWWVQDKVAAGMTASVFGRNLAHGNVEGNSNSYVYIKSSTGAGQWAQVTRVNPYKVQYTVPSSLSAGRYELWVHNGHGGDWGWSKPLVVTVVATSNNVLSKSWGSVVNVAAPSGDASTNVANINSAIAGGGSSGNRIQFGTGVYTINGPLNINSNTKWKGIKDGSGNPATVIRVVSSFNNAGEGLLNRNGSLTMNQFEDIKFESNGFTTDNANAALMDIDASNMVSFINCYLDAKYMGNAIRMGNGFSNIYFYNCQIYGGAGQFEGATYLNGGNQLFITNCTIKMTKDCEAAIITRHVSRSSMEGCKVQDYDNATTDGSGWGKGRIWASNGSGGSAYHCYFGGNTGTALGTRQSGTNQPDPNSGEMFLWEVNATVFSAAPDFSTATTINFSSAVPKNKEFCIAIIKGKGIGQFRKIIANNGRGVLTVNEPWQVLPDGSSVAVIGPYMEKMVFYKNQLDANGKGYIATNGIDNVTASAGIEPYGGCFDFIADNNTMTGLRKGLSTWVTQHGISIDPSYFCLYINNKMIGCRTPFHHASEVSAPAGAGLLGIVYRNNVVQSPLFSATQSDMHADNIASLTAMVYEHNNYSNAPLGFSTGNLRNPDPRVDFGFGGLENQVFYKNNFSSVNSCIKITPKIVLRENVYEGFSTIYSGSLPAAPVVEAPYHVVEINAPAKDTLIKTPFTLVNAGTAAMIWTATSNALWLKLSQTSGEIKNEKDKSVLKLIVNPNKLEEGIHKGNIIISVSEQKEAYTVILIVSRNNKVKK